MSDNISITPGVGATVATDDVGGVQYQRVKVDPGIEGFALGDLTEVAINVASSGDNSIVAATAAQIIRVWAFWFKVNGGAVNLKWRSAANDLHPALPFNDREGWVMPLMLRPWLTCTVAEALNLNLSAAIQVSGRLYFTKG